jgi:hypothetical protein
MNKKYYNQLSRKIRYAKFMYLCTKKDKWREKHNFYLGRIKAVVSFYTEYFKNNRYLNMTEL